MTINTKQIFKLLKSPYTALFFITLSIFLILPGLAKADDFEFENLGGRYDFNCKEDLCCQHYVATMPLIKYFTTDTILFNEKGPGTYKFIIGSTPGGNDIFESEVISNPALVFYEPIHTFYIDKQVNVGSDYWVCKKIVSGDVQAEWSPISQIDETNGNFYSPLYGEKTTWDIRFSLYASASTTPPICATTTPTATTTPPDVNNAWLNFSDIGTVLVMTSEGIYKVIRVPFFYFVFIQIIIINIFMVFYLFKIFK